MAWTSDDLVTDVRRTAMTPSSSASATADTDILAHADKETATVLVPAVMGVAEEWFVRTTSFATVASQNRYQLPTRTIAGRVKDVQMVRGGAFMSLPRIEPEREPEWAAPGVTGVPVAFYMQAGAVVLVPTPNDTSNTVTVRYFARPSRLVAVSSARVITSVPASGSNWDITWTSGATLGTSGSFDIVRAEAPFDFVSVGLTATGGSSTTLTISGSSWGYTNASLERTQAVGAYVTAADTSPVVGLPDPLFYVLSQRTAGRVLESSGYLEEGAAALKQADQMLAQAIVELTPRVDAKTRKLTSFASGPFRATNSPFPWWCR